MTFEKDSASNECKSKEDEFEEFLQKEFKYLEKDYDEIRNLIERLKQDKFLPS